MFVWVVELAVWFRHELSNSRVLSHGTGGLISRDHEEVQDILFPLAAAGCMDMEYSSSSELPTFCKEPPSPMVQPVELAKQSDILKHPAQSLQSSSFMNCWK